MIFLSDQGKSKQKQIMEKLGYINIKKRNKIGLVLPMQVCVDFFYNIHSCSLLKLLLR